MMQYYNFPWAHPSSSLETDQSRITMMSTSFPSGKGPSVFGRILEDHGPVCLVLTAGALC